MHTLKKSIACAVSVMAVAGALIQPVTVNAETQVTYETVLGKAYDYGIIANEYDQQNHTQTNFAVNTFNSNNVVEADLSGEGHVPFIAKNITNQLRFGNHTYNGQETTYDVMTMDGDKVSSDNQQNGKINILNKTEGEITDTMNGFISQIKQSSESLKNHEATITVTDDMVTDQNHWTLDLTGYPDESTVYVNVPDSASKFTNLLRTTGALNIAKNDGTTVVFNIEADNLTIGKYNVTVNGTTTDTTPDTSEGTVNQTLDNKIIRKIIWNAYNAKALELNTTAGLFVAPQDDATVTVTGTSSGWIATAGKATNTNGEWHFAFHARSEESKNPDVVVPTPTPTPDVPEPKPEPDVPEVRTGKLVITKTIAGDVTKEEAEGALQFAVTNNDSSETSTYTLHDFTYENGKYTKELELNEGGYTVSEDVYDINGYTLAYAGYMINGENKTEGTSAAVNVAKDTTTTLDYVDTYKIPTYEVSIGKVDINDSHELPGATLRITQGDRTVEEWVSTTEERKVNLKAGDYTLTEITAPTGYDVAESMNFSVTSEGKVTVNGEEVTSVVMKDNPTPKPVEKTSVSVKKVFDDDDNRDGIRPLMVHIDLLADGAVKDTVKLDDRNSWAYTWSNLDKMNNGKTIVYTVEETAVYGYKTSITENGENSFVVTNTHKPETIDIDVSTSWDDLDNQDQVRPEEYEISLLADDYAVDDAVLNVDNDFSHTFEDMPVKDNGHEIDYDVAMKDGIDKYDSKLEGNFKDGFTFTHVERSQEPVVEKGKLIITKQLEGDITPEEAEGSLRFTVTNNDTQQAETFTLADFDLADCKYTLELEENVGGYTVKETDFDINGFEASVSYTVNGTATNGSEAVITVDRDATTQIDFVDHYELNTHDVVISKVDINSSEELPGATLQVLQSDKLIEEWVSTAEKHTIALKPGDYTLKEITAPDGYEVAESIDFSVDRNGKVTVNGEEATEVVMKDALKPAPEPVKTDVSISKTDISGTEIEGAELTITRNGETVETWTSTKEAHVVSLPEGKYVLTETQAPFGYEVAESIEFEIGNDGKVVGQESNKITMIDAYSTHDVTISKKDVGGNELPGAHLSILNRDNRVVESWISASTPRTVKLLPGDYTLHEDTAPAGYDVTNDIQFSVAVDGTVTVNGNVVTTITMVDEAKETVVPAPKPDKPKPSETAKPEVPAEQPKKEVPVSKVESSGSADTSNALLIGSFIGVVALAAGFALIVFTNKNRQD